MVNDRGSGRRVRTKRAIWPIALIPIAIGFMIGLGFNPISSFFGGGSNIAEFEEGLMASSNRPRFEAMREYYPEEYQGFLEEIVERIEDGQSDTEVLMFVEGFFNDFLADRHRFLMSAPDEQLNESLSAHINLINQMRLGSVSTCANYVLTGHIASGPQNNPLIVRSFATYYASQLAAVHAGEQNAGSPRAEPTAAEFDAYVAAVRSRTPELAGMIIDHTLLEAASPEEQCEAGLENYRAMDDLPSEASANMFAYLLLPAGES